MIIGVVLICLELIVLWELVYLALVVISLPTNRRYKFMDMRSKPANYRNNIHIDERQNVIVPNTTHISFPEPDTNKYQSTNDNEEKQQLNNGTPNRMNFTPLLKQGGKDDETDYTYKEENYDKRRLVFPHDAILWLFRIINRLIRGVNTNRGEPVGKFTLILRLAFF